jgi:hypothetical protein
LSNAESYPAFRQALQFPSSYWSCWQAYVAQAVGGELDVLGLIGGAEDRADIQKEVSMWLRKRGDRSFLRGM